MNKRTATVSIAWTDDDKEVAATCRLMAGAFKPSRSFLLLLFLRHTADRVIRGEVTLETLCNKYSEAIPETTTVTARSL